MPDYLNNRESLSSASEEWAAYPMLFALGSRFQTLLTYSGVTVLVSSI